eukprot:6255682-Alexandrium_andersonii.AAC.1
MRRWAQEGIDAGPRPAPQAGGEPHLAAVVRDLVGRSWWPGPPFPCSWGEGLGWGGGPEPDHLDI